MSDAMIHFDQVSLTLGNVPILQGVTFDVKPGSIHCIVGPNGGGKTSLVRCLLGQMPYTGTIHIDWRAGLHIGYVPQMLHFDLTLPVTVEDFLATVLGRRPAFLGPSARHRDAIDAVLEQVKMTAKRKRRLGLLSGGERQRVLFAQALTPPPDLLVLDEPMTGLDQAGAAIIEEAILGLRERGVPILWVHHDIQHVRRIADAVTCINRRVMFSGAPAEVLTTEAVLRMFSTEIEGGGAQPHPHSDSHLRLRA